MRIISGKRKGGKLYEVTSGATRSTTDKVKESIFNIIGPYFDGGVCLDFFSGSGSLCLEALSRGFDFAYLFDRADEPITVIKKNVSKFKFEDQTLIRQTDFKNALDFVDKKLDLVFLDPPYGYNYVNEALTYLKASKKMNLECMVICEVENTESILHEGYKLIDERIYGRIKIIILELI